MVTSSRLFQQSPTIYIFSPPGQPIWYNQHFPKSMRPSI
jgi:hypothetical protein